METSMKTLSLEEMTRVTGGLEDPIVSTTVTWEDGNGNKYSYTIGKPELPDVISQSVSWEDAGGNRYTQQYSGR